MRQERVANPQPILPAIDNLQTQLARLGEAVLKNREIEPARKRR
jgi:hypothetical protein